MASHYSPEQYEELKKAFPNIEEHTDVYEYILLPAVQVIDKHIDLLLCPQSRDGYHSRLFFSEKLKLKDEEKPWTAFHMCDRNWYAYSWQPPTNLTLIQMVGNHLKAIK